MPEVIRTLEFTTLGSLGFSFKSSIFSQDAKVKPTIRINIFNIVLFIFFNFKTYSNEKDLSSNAKHAFNKA
jgi:hypothetical protein